MSLHGNRKLNKPIRTPSASKKFGVFVKNKRTGDMFKYGIIDPLKVTKMALKNAISVSNTILQTNCVISNKRA